MSKQSVCRFIATKVMGWTLVGEPVKEPKCILLGAPHTSIWDFVIAFLFYTAIGGNPRIIVKSQFFVWPLKSLLLWAGAIPVEREKGVDFVNKVIETLHTEEKFHLAIAPEGTRKPTLRWKRGFHTIARRLQIPVYYGYFDWKRKEIGIGPRVEITNDFNADILKIRQWYKDKGVVGKHPKKFIC